MSNSKSRNVDLSHEGEVRRAEMLSQLKLEMKARQTRQFQLRGGLILSGCLAVILAFSFWPSSNEPEDSNLAQNRSVVDPHPVHSSGKRVALVQNRVSVVSKYVVSRRKPMHVELEILDDRQLEQQLSDAGMPSVVGRIGGELRVVALD